MGQQDRAEAEPINAEPITAVSSLASVLLGSPRVLHMTHSELTLGGSSLASLLLLLLKALFVLFTVLGIE